MICENCGKEHDGSYGSGRFCSKECAKGYSGKKCKNEVVERKCIICGKPVLVNVHKAISKTLCEECEKTEYIKQNKVNKRTEQRKCILYNCKGCEECVFIGICKSKNSVTNKLKTLYKYFPDILDENLLFDYEYIKDKYLYIKNMVQILLDNNLSSNEICLKLFGSHKRGNTVLGILECKTHTLSDSIKIAFLNGKLGTNEIVTKYKSCWHTTWENKEVFLRSSYELDYAIELDKKQIKYDVESLRIKYFDSQKLTFRCAVPDFYLPETNEIVEIKSSWTYDEQNIKDKFNAYKNLGYKTKLILDHVEIVL